jgi:hypothetical protein
MALNLHEQEKTPSQKIWQFGANLIQG